MIDKPPKISWRAALHPRYLSDPSTLILLAANTLPLLGIFLWDWDLFLLMVLYWLETGIIGFWSILRMAIQYKWLSLFLVPFFTLHFGGFMTGHFVFLNAMFSGPWAGKIKGVPDFVEMMVFQSDLWIPFLALFISHGASFFLNFLRPRMIDPSPLPDWGQMKALWMKAVQAQKRGQPLPADDSEQQKVAEKMKAWTRNLQDPMTEPYHRIVVMHLTIIFGGFLSMVLHIQAGAFILMVALKTLVDMAAHVRKNFKPDPASPGVSV